MNPVVEAALISAGAAIFGVGGTAIVAVLGYRNSRAASQAAIDAGREANEQTSEIARQALAATDRAQDRALELTEQGQVTDRYIRAIEQIGSDKLDVRVGAIYALERIARDSPRDHPTIMEVLAIFVRENSKARWPPAVSAKDAPERTVRPDVRAALIVVGRRDVTNDSGQINLSEAQLAGAYLKETNFARATFFRSDLTSATFVRANLQRSVLYGVSLMNANLHGADMRGANLRSANLFGAHLNNADLRDADVAGAQYDTNTVFTGARVTSSMMSWLSGTSWKLGEDGRLTPEHTQNPAS
jgi:hypothetical protein